MRCTHTVDAGVYVLGALAPVERSGYERHLNTCQDCREEVAELAGLPGLLGRLDSGTASSMAQLAPDPAPAGPRLLDTVLRQARRERGRLTRRRRWQMAGATLAAACLAAVVGVGVSMMDNRTQPTPIVAQMQPIEADIPVTAALAYTPQGNGTMIHMVCLYRASTEYPGPWDVRLVVYPRDGGTPYETDTWPVQAGQEVHPDEWVGMKPSEIARIELTTQDGTRLLVYQPT
jgi:hypothetical protein